MNRRFTLALPFLVASTAGCSTFLPKAPATAATAGTSDSESTQLWGIAKGMGLAALKAAEIVAPLVVPGLAPALAIVQGIIDAAAPLEASLSVDSTAAAQLGALATKLTLAAAPLVTIASNVKPS